MPTLRFGLLTLPEMAALVKREVQAHLVRDLLSKIRLDNAQTVCHCLNAAVAWWQVCVGMNPALLVYFEHCL